MDLKDDQLETKQELKYSHGHSVLWGQYLYVHYLTKCNMCSTRKDNVMNELCIRKVIILKLYLIKSNYVFN